jgi:hypothetical protein
MNLEIVTHEILGASVEDLAQILRLVSNHSLALHDTVIIDRNGRAVLSEVRRDLDALANTLFDLAARQKAGLQNKSEG